MVWPCEPMAVMRLGSSFDLRMTASAAWAKCSPKRKLSSQISSTVPCKEVWRILPRSLGEKGRWKWAISSTLRPTLRPEIVAATASMPSAEVPDIRPTNNWESPTGMGLKLDRHSRCGKQRLERASGHRDQSDAADILHVSAA